MVLITEELVRKKSEHNELIIGSLEELSLHQEDIEKIEHIQNWCRNLKILYLQSNLISRIENLHKLKCLQYLNLAVNNIEKIENLEKLESLRKLDLTLNFIGDLQSVNNLKNNYNFRQLILTGNPCTDFENYRNYVLAVLPQLENLDCNDIKMSDKILAKQNFRSYRDEIIQAEVQYRIARDEQKCRVKQQQADLSAKMAAIDDESERTRLFWDTKSENCPETREEIVKIHRKGKNLDVKPPVKTAPPIKFFGECGRPFNMNQAKLQFHLVDEADRYELELHIFRYLDTSFINVDVQPNYVRVKVKQKYFQLSLANEINCSESSTKRSQASGILLVVMPKLISNSGKFVLNAVCADSADIKKYPDPNKPSILKGTVNYKNIIKPTGLQSTSSSSSLSSKDLAEIPLLI